MFILVCPWYYVEEETSSISNSSLENKVFIQWPLGETDKVTHHFALLLKYEMPTIF